MTVNSGIVLVGVRPPSCLGEFIHCLTFLECFLGTFEGVPDCMLSLCRHVTASVCLHSLLSTLFVEASSAHDVELTLVTGFGLTCAREGPSGQHEVDRVVYWRSESLIFHGFSVAS